MNNNLDVVAERLEHARNVPSDSDPWVRCERAALFFLNSAGVERLSQVSFKLDYRDDKTKWSAWVAESIIFAIDRIRAGDDKEGVRGMFQVCEYAGRAGGFIPGHLADAKGELRNYFERKLAKS